MKKLTLITMAGLCAAAVLLTAPVAFAQDGVTTDVSSTATLTNGSFTDNFSEMTSTQTTAPTGWSVYSESGSHYTFEPAGDYNGTGTQTTTTNPNLTGTLTAETTLIAATGSQTTTNDNNSGGVKGVEGVNFNNSSLATAQNGEGARSLGACPSGNAATILELNLTNTSGAAINAVNISYDIDRYTTAVDDNNVPSQYPNATNEEFPGFQLFYNLTPGNNADWVNVSALNPTVNSGTTGAVQVPNSVGITQVGTAANPNLVTLNSAWTSGSTIAFAWLADNSAGPSPDQNIGLNNVVIAAAAVPEPGSFGLGFIAVGAAFILLRLRRQRA